MEKNARIATLALFIALAVSLHWLESYIPRPAPFLRFGLANIMTLCTLYTFGGFWALFVVVSRVVIASALTGSIFSPAFLFSMSGGISSGIIMWIMPRSLFSPLGISVGGAVAHMFTQVMLASVLMAHMSLLKTMPVFILVSVLAGMINGYCVRIIIEVMEERSLNPFLSQ